ncbi:hypothetical protein [Marivita sp. GX14005]|uniref:hypothetical protein n=1 Tax=Marivita sp. GX14005 TaxID=2942276 RepID=UPI002019EB7A|nr:hypothetical protein [Marivita sp. GX14005]MCL3883895.1 hypothetical protein [Marivita sp. GX14005]
MTEFPENLFAQIYRRAPTEQDRTRLMGIKAGLGLSPRDELWPVILVLDHYDRAIRSGRAATLRDVERVIEELNAVPDRAGPIASAEARKAIARIIEAASDKIARASSQKSITTADRISRRQFIVAALVGAFSAACLALAAAWGTYEFLEARGLCAEPPFPTVDGQVGCFVQR